MFARVQWEAKRSTEGDLILEHGTLLQFISHANQIVALVAWDGDGVNGYTRGKVFRIGIDFLRVTMVDSEQMMKGAGT